jgi:hypothetical protein
VKREYQIASKEDSGKLAEFLAEQREVLLPMVELIEQGRMAVEELVGSLGRAALEAVLLVSAEQVAMALLLQEPLLIRYIAASFPPLPRDGVTG